MSIRNESHNNQEDEILNEKNEYEKEYGKDNTLEAIVRENEMLKKKIEELRMKLLEKEMTLELLKRTPQMICEVVDVIDNKAIIKIPNGNKFLVEIVSEEKIQPGDNVIVDKNNLNIIGKIDIASEFDVKRFVIIEKPKVTWKDVGGLKDQIQEIKEVIELPLKKPQLFKKIGIEPPKGILLYGPPGTGKTLVAKAVANETNATFIELVGSELVQKFIGEGAKLVKEVFDLARKLAPSIVFIDEIDSIAAKRIELGTSGEREVQRTFMQLLAEIDGFKPLDQVKIIGATNRIDILDKAILRPGRLDRLIKFDIPKTTEQRIEIIRIHTRKMPLKDVTLKDIAILAEGFSGAEIKALCTEAGYSAIRAKRSHITFEDFRNAKEKIKREEKENKEYVGIYG